LKFGIPARTEQRYEVAAFHSITSSAIYLTRLSSRSSTFIFVGSLARSRPRSQRRSSAERYEKQDEFWSSYRRHFLELTLWEPAASDAPSFGDLSMGNRMPM